VSLAFAGWILCSPEAVAQVTDQAISNHLRRALESAPVPLDLRIGDEEITAAEALPVFYEQRAYQPAWVTSLGPVAGAVYLVEFLLSLPREGLRPEEYHAGRLQWLLGAIGNETPALTAGVFAELDLLLTDAFLMVGAHLVSGRVDPATFDREWVAVRREVDLVQLLSTALANGSIREALDSLQPDHRGYLQLRDLGELYRGLAADGGWPVVPDGPRLEIDERSPRIVDLRRRLVITDGLTADAAATDQELFDDEVDAALQRFQARHGLEPDGILGAKTLAALNVPVEERLNQIYLNLERWRWLPQSLGARYVLVNLPAFDLRVIEEGQTSLEMRVAVGRRYRRTPVFSDAIRYLVFNPYWEIPASIAMHDKLPEIKRDVTYLKQQGIRVLAGWATDQREIDPSTLDWSSFGVGNFPYRLRQDPGPLNALGRVKFMFPNRFNVYLHDTPGKEVFERAERDVSSGCIRLAKPLELAELLLQKNRLWQPGTTREFLGDHQERTVRLDAPWPVHLLHWTAWIGEDQVVHFRADLYGRDERLTSALFPKKSRL
jgi:murein L,D-transpeptidase YcbB/YkuD